MKILITGIDGYVGWPTALRISKRYPESQIIGVDNFGRRRWVEECGAVSAVPIFSMEERIQAAKKHGFKNIEFQELDLVNRDDVYLLLQEFRPDVILHLAAQPSAPYSELNGERANYTQHNNVQGTRNLLWGVKENNLLDSLFVETTTTGIYGAPEFEIPEGFFEIKFNNRPSARNCFLPCLWVFFNRIRRIFTGGYRNDEPRKFKLSSKRKGSLRCRLPRRIGIK